MFRVGDEVECVDASDCPELVEGAPYIVERIVQCGDEILCTDGEWSIVTSEGVSVWVFGGQDFRVYEDEETPSGYKPERFRKVERKSDSLSIEAFLTIKPGQYEEPKRTNQPAKRKEQA